MIFDIATALKNDTDLRSFLWYSILSPVKTARSLRVQRIVPQIYPALQDVTTSPCNGVPESPLPWEERTVTHEESVNIRLAGVALECCDLANIEWQSDFCDIEDYASLHRFAWLLPLILDFSTQGDAKQMVWTRINAVMADWIQHHSAPRPDSEVWQPYTVSERLVNWMVAALSCGRLSEFCSEYADNLNVQATYLKDNVEYFGELYTCNHLSNNGRALYLIGLALGIDEYRSVGRQIILGERSRLFSEPGILREGSSHYQFLVTRNYCELLWFARSYHDTDTAAALKETVADLTKGCRIFLLNRSDGTWDIPLIGDISPDCPPLWFLGVPWVGAQLTGTPSPPGAPAEKGWHNFFLAAALVSAQEEGARVDGIQIGKEWARISKGPWSVFAHVNPSGFPIIAGHAHQDTGAIAAYFDGWPLLVDCGRSRYGNDAESIRGRDWYSHSIAVLDSCNPAPYYRRVYPEEFLVQRTGELPRLSACGDHLEIRHGGYCRLGGGGSYSRQVFCSEKSMSILDRFEGRGNHPITLLFHIPCEVSLQGLEATIWVSSRPDRFRLRLPDGLTDVQLVCGKAEDYHYGWASRHYGDSSNLCTIVAQGKVRLPWSGTSILEKI